MAPWRRARVRKAYNMATMPPVRPRSWQRLGVRVAAGFVAVTLLGIGGQVLLSPFTYERIRAVSEVGPPIPVEVKGIREPLLLYELRALTGRYPRRLPDADGRSGPEVPVSLPLECWSIEGKAVSPQRLSGEVTRLGLARLEARLDTRLNPLANVRLRLHFPALAQRSEDLYGKVLAASEDGRAWVVRIALTSVDAADQRILEGLLRGDSGARA